MPDLATFQALLKPLFPGLMGVQLTCLAEDRVVGELEVRPALCNASGVLDGGALMALADTLGAVGTMLNLPRNKRTTTTDSSTKFIRAARLNMTVVGESVALHRGRTTMVWQTSVRTRDGKLCAVVTQTQLVLDSV